MSVRAANSAPKKSTFTSGADCRSTGPGRASKKPVCTGPGGAACFGVSSSRRNNRAFSACRRAVRERRLATSSASSALRRLEIVVHTTHRRTQPAGGEVARLTLGAQYEIRHRRRGRRSESVRPYLALSRRRQQLRLTAALLTRTSSGTAGRGSVWPSLRPGDLDRRRRAQE